MEPIAMAMKRRKLEWFRQKDIKQTTSEYLPKETVRRDMKAWRIREAGREKGTGLCNTCYPHTAVFYAETRPSVLWTGKTKCGRVLICLDGCGRVKKHCFLILMYHGLQYVGLLRALYRALYTSCYCHIM